jgi:hypothetical protein
MASNRIARLHVAPITTAEETVMESIFVRCKPRLRIIVLAVLLSAMAGCGGPSRDVVGKWRLSQETDAMVWEFSKNGAVVIGNTQGRYILDRNRVKIETPFAKTVYHMEFSGDRMILREPNGSKLEFTRIRENKG